MDSKAEWEYRDFVYPFSPDTPWIPLGNDFFANVREMSVRNPVLPASEKPPFSRLPNAREIFWRENRERIREAVAVWLKEGWEPADRMSSSGIAVRLSRNFWGPRPLRVLQWALTILLLGLPLFWRCTYAQPFEFRVAMRRMKSHG